MSFLRKIEELSELYQTYERGKKHIVVDLVLDWLASCRGHFVKLDSEGYWVEVSKNTAKKKVALAFRHRKLALQHASKPRSEKHRCAGLKPVSLRSPRAPGKRDQAECFNRMGAATVVHTANQQRNPTGKVLSTPLQLSGAPLGFQQRPQSGMTVNHLPNQIERLQVTRLVYPPHHMGRIGINIGVQSRMDVQFPVSREPPLVSDEEILRAVREWEMSAANAGKITGETPADIDSDDDDLSVFT